MTNKKPTKKMNYEAIKKLLANANRPDLIDFCDHEIELLDNRKKTTDGEKKLTPKQKENLVLVATILDNMEVDTIYSISDMQRKIEVCKELTNQKISSLIRQAMSDGTIERVEVKGKAFFKLAKVKG